MKNNFLLVAILFSTILFAQEKGIISGTILDAEHHDEPMLFAHISLKGTEIQERTNIFGNFQITDTEPGDYILTVSFTGYETKEIPVVVLAGERTMVQTGILAKTIEIDEIALTNMPIFSQVEQTPNFALGSPNK